MTRTVLLYGISMAILISLLKFFEYKLFIQDLSIEIYIGIIASLFTALGVWVGFKLTRKKTVIIAHSDFQFDQSKLDKLGISKREYEVLELMAKGFSNQEIADQLFVSLNTVKTHASNLFVKLDTRRRTQAIQKAKDLNLIP